MPGERPGSVRAAVHRGFITKDGDGGSVPTADTGLGKAI